MTPICRILSIGRELLLGHTLDTNASWLCRQLSAHGWKISGIELVDDDRAPIIAAIQRAAADASLILITGGLGPTPDDLTRQCITTVLGVELIERPEWIEMIETRFRSFGRSMRPSNRIQACIPEGAEGLDNPNGTAPGIAARLDATLLFAMPGVPHEMKAMFQNEVLPRLPDTGRQTEIDHYRLHGISESRIGEWIREWEPAWPALAFGTTVQEGIVTLRVSSDRREPLDAFRPCGRATFGADMITVGDRPLAGVVLDLLREQNQTLALAESCTGGMIASALVDIPGSSDVFVEGMVTYAYSAKTRTLGVPEALLAREGAVCPEVVKIMAEAARTRTGADYAIAVSGIAGPGGGSEDKPVGTVWLALTGPMGIVWFCRHIPGDRERIRRRTTVAALDCLRRMVLQLDYPWEVNIEQRADVRDTL